MRNERRNSIYLFTLVECLDNNYEHDKRVGLEYVFNPNCGT